MPMEISQATFDFCGNNHATDHDWECFKNHIYMVNLGMVSPRMAATPPPALPVPPGLRVPPGPGSPDDGRMQLQRDEDKGIGDLPKALHLPILLEILAGDLARFCWDFSMGFHGNHRNITWKTIKVGDSKAGIFVEIIMGS